VPQIQRLRRRLELGFSEHPHFSRLLHHWRIRASRILFVLGRTLPRRRAGSVGDVGHAGQGRPRGWRGRRVLRGIKRRLALGQTASLSRELLAEVIPEAPPDDVPVLGALTSRVRSAERILGTARPVTETPEEE